MLIANNKSVTINHKFKGFTLIELLVVITIIAVLVGLGFTAYTKTQKQSRDARRKSDVEEIKKASYLFFQDRKAFPCWSVNPNACVSLSTGGHAQVVAGTPIESHLVPKYMEKMPADPSGTSCGYMFGSMPYGASFTVFTVLENTNDFDAKAVKPAPKYTPSGSSTNGNITWTMSAGSCTGTVFNYWVNNP